MYNHGMIKMGRTRAFMITLILSACSPDISSSDRTPYESMFDKNMRICQAGGMSIVDCQVQEYRRSLANDRIYDQQANKSGGDDF